MSINPMVYEQMSLNSKKLNQLGISELILTTLPLSNSTFPKIKVFNSGLCIFATDNFNYLLSLPKEYESNYLSRNLRISKYSKIYLTYFNCIISPTEHLFISAKDRIREILNIYFQYMKFINDVEMLRKTYLLNNREYKISCKKYNVFILGSHFVKHNIHKYNTICIEIEE